MYREGHGQKQTDATGRVELIDQSGEGWYNFAALLCTDSSQIGTIRRRSAALACNMHYQGAWRCKMAQTKQQLVQELNHEIHSPLAAIRNALYLAAVRSSDPATLRYLELADAEISRIAAVLKKVNQAHENKRVQILIPSVQPISAA
jgi:nitrogen-specific signal transduction histidine kinase